MNRKKLFTLIAAILIVLAIAVVINYTKPSAGIGSNQRPSSGLGSSQRPGAGIGSHFRPTDVCYKPGNGPC